MRERVQGLQTDSSNTDTALATLEEALSEKVRVMGKSTVSIQKEKVKIILLVNSQGLSFREMLSCLLLDGWKV